MPPTRPPADTHEWASFEDLDEDRTWVFDLTFLESPWTCIFGQGCQGVLTEAAPELVQGCCSYGAHFVDEDDLARVERAAATLEPDEWQFHARATKNGKGGTKGGIAKRNRHGELVTRLVDDACIFLNRPGHPSGPGCALHQAALRRGVEPLELKPDVCWQLPLRREDQVAEGGHVTSVLRQWDRSHWGAGGEEFHWWCTESPDAFVGAEPVHRTMAAEIRAMVGKKVFRRLEALLAERTANRQKGVPLPHPALRTAR